MDSEERFRLLIETVRDYAIYMLDLGGVITSWNFGAERIKGYRANEVVGRHFSIFYTSDDIARGKPQHHLDVAARLGQVEDEGWRVRKDGSRFWADVVLTAIRDHNLRPIGFSKIVHDLTERKRADEALRESQELLRLSLDSALDAVITMNEGGVITLWNAQAEKIFGWTSLEAVGAQLAELIMPPRFRVAHSLGLQRFLSTGQGPLLGKRIEIAAMRRDGDEFPVELSISPFKAGGKWLFSGFVRDISESRRVAQILRETQDELARVSRLTTMGEITASITHEMTQPLAAIRTNGDTALRWLRAQPPNLEKGEAAIGRVIEDVRRANEVIERVRALFRNTGTERARLNIDDLIKDVVALTQDEMRRRRISVAIQSHAGLPCVSGDRVQLQQVLLNLMINAADAMDAITDRPRALFVTSRLSNGAGVVVTVRDTGTGFAQVGVDKMFQAFFTTKSNGMGLGLSICQTIVEAHGGRLWAEPGEPCGALFQFNLPTLSDADFATPARH